MSEFLHPQMWIETRKSEAIFLIRAKASSRIRLGKAMPWEFFIPMGSVGPWEYGLSTSAKNRLLRVPEKRHLPKPVKGMLRFILIETSHGQIILTTSDLNLDPVTAIQPYCRRVTIETMFDALAAIEKFVNVQILGLGMLQIIAKQFPAEVKITQGQRFCQESSLI